MHLSRYIIPPRVPLWGGGGWLRHFRFAFVDPDYLKLVWQTREHAQCSSVPWAPLKRGQFQPNTHKQR